MSEEEEFNKLADQIQVIVRKLVEQTAVQADVNATDPRLAKAFVEGLTKELNRLKSLSD